MPFLSDFPDRGRYQRNAHAGGDQIDAGQHLLDLGDDKRFETGLVARINDVAVHARSGRAGAPESAARVPTLSAGLPRAHRKLCA